MMNKNKGYVNQDYLNQAAQMFSPIKLNSYEKLLENNPQSLIDIGCGPGIDTTTIATIHPDTPQIIGVDFDKEMIQQADSLAKQKECSDRTQHQHASVYELPFADNTFDAIRAERLFMHLEDPHKALQEIARIAKPDAQLVIIETDWASMSVNNNMDALERRLSHYFANEFLNNGYSARRLPGQLAQLKLQETEIDIRSLQSNDHQLWQLLSQHMLMMEKALENDAINEEEYQAWIENLNESKVQNSFFSTINIMTFCCKF